MFSRGLIWGGASLLLVALVSATFLFGLAEEGRGGQVTPPPGLRAVAGAGVNKVAAPLPLTPGAGDAVAALQPGETRLRSLDRMEMVYVPAGPFTMGNDHGDSPERPAHTVTLDAFWIDKYEVTNAQYRACVAAGACHPATECDWGQPTYDAVDKGNYPVVCVNWQDAQNYCTWVGARLPTEAQWERAARGDDGRLYPWGHEFDPARLNFCDKNCEFANAAADADDGYVRTAPVGSYPAGVSPYGVHDLAGNVWEWTADWYDDEYYATSPPDNPKGPAAGSGKVLRGGGWNFGPVSARATHRTSHGPDNRYHIVGLRCAAVVNFR
jgi:formylglycine-generating enzyme required for sulfatase activity